jgi:hypothetical protein
MPRLSVYIPVELLEQAKGLEESENTSRLVQRGLERLVEEQTRTPSYARTPEGSFERILNVRDRLLAEARADYERGYAIALEAATAMPLHVINTLVDADFDLEKWLQPFKDGLRYDLIQKSGRPIEDQDEIQGAINRSAEELKGKGLASAFNKRDEWWWLWKTAEALGSLADPIGFDDFTFTPTKARQRGFTDAMRELWSALENPGGSYSDLLHQVGKVEEDYRRKKAEGGEADDTGDEDDS